MTVQSLLTVLLIVSTFCSGKWSSWSCLAPPSYKPLLSHAEPETKSECQNLPCKTTNHKPQYCSPSLAPSADLPNNYPRLLSASTSVSPSHAATAAYAPKNKADLKVAVGACIGLSPSGHCPAAWGPIGSWDVPAVTDMSQLFSNTNHFNDDLSKWDVSSVTNMSWMFTRAYAFNQDLSKWDVSSVTDMWGMFWGTHVFNHKLCGDAWVQSKAIKSMMFIGSPGSISKKVCKTATPGYFEREDYG